MNKKKFSITLASLIFGGLLAFWGVIAAKGLQGDTDTAEIFSAIYCSMALFGGLVGLGISRHWGGFRSLIGRAVLFMSLGLLAQAAGQLTYSAYTYLFNHEIPYPSLGDIGFFGSVIFYILAGWSLVQAVSTKAALRSKRNKTLVVAVPVALLAVSYIVFLKGYEFDTSQPLIIFLDFGYPLGQAIYVSLALLAFIVSKKYLGGIMKPVILALIFAFVLQFAADFMFLYQVSRETWETAGLNELVYLSAYYFMTISLISFGTVLDKMSGRAGGK